MTTNNRSLAGADPPSSLSTPHSTAPRKDPPTAGIQRTVFPIDHDGEHASVPLGWTLWARFRREEHAYSLTRGTWLAAVPEEVWIEDESGRRLTMLDPFAKVVCGEMVRAMKRKMEEDSE